MMAVLTVAEVASSSTITGDLQLPSPEDEEFVILSLPPCHYYMPVILDGVIRSSGKELCDGGPSAAVHPVGRHQPLLFFLRERLLIDPWIQLVEPSQSAAFTFVNGDDMQSKIMGRTRAWSNRWTDRVIDQ